MYVSSRVGTLFLHYVVLYNVQHKMHKCDMCNVLKRRKKQENRPILAYTLFQKGAVKRLKVACLPPINTRRNRNPLAHAPCQTASRKKGSVLATNKGICFHAQNVS